MSSIHNMAFHDFRLIYRDPSLRVFLLLPFLIIAVVCIGLPILIEKYAVIDEYVLPILIISSIETTQLFSFLYAMLFIEEKETKTNVVYGVLPTSNAKTILVRFLLPLCITLCINMLLLTLQPFYELDLLKCLLYSIVLSLVVPIYALGVSILSQNKMEGLVWIKAFNILIVLPLLMFFFQHKLIHILGIIPSYWLMVSLESIIVASSSFYTFISAAFIFILVLMLVFIRQFRARHYNG